MQAIQLTVTTGRVLDAGSAARLLTGTSQGVTAAAAAFSHVLLLQLPGLLHKLAQQAH
jgi:hypothetical protein